MGSLEARVQLQQGYVDSAPLKQFDGATCLLTLHFLSVDERLRTLREIHRRLKPGSPIVVAHDSWPAGGDLRQWVSRSAAFTSRSGVDFATASASADIMAANLPILPADQDEKLLRWEPKVIHSDHYAKEANVLAPIELATSTKGRRTHRRIRRRPSASEYLHQKLLL